MKLIFKYLKPYLFIVLTVVALTFVQVQTELTLPDYMSGIVTNGIQYGGVTEEMPHLITAKDMDDVLSFLSESERENVLAKYQRIKAGSKGQVDDMEVEFREDVWLINEEDEETKALLREPLVYTYLARVNHLSLDDADAIKKLAASYEDNYSGMIRFFIRDLYRNAGMAIDQIQNRFILSSGMKMLGIAAIGVPLLHVVSDHQDRQRYHQSPAADPDDDADDADVADHGHHGSRQGPALSEHFLAFDGGDRCHHLCDDRSGRLCGAEV